MITKILFLFALMNPPTFALATPAIAPRATKTTNQRQRNFIPSPLFSSSSSSTAANTDSGQGKINGSAPVEDNKLLENIRKASNIASILCVLDCTLLPIITVALPLFGVLNLGPEQMHFLHELGHKLALYFVLPVGGSTGLINYLSHKKSWIAAMTAMGLVMVGFANAHIHHLPIFGHVEFLHLIQHGPLHRVTNILGCGLLLGSNYLSQKQGCAFDDGCDSHSHDHSHSHGHGHSH